MSDTELKEKELAAQEPPSSNESKDELDSADRLGKGYRREKKKSRGVFKSGKSRMAAIVVTTVVAGGGIFGVLQAPNFFINHLRELLLTKVSQLQNHHQRQYRRSKINKVSDLFSRDGRRGGKIIAEMERRGYRFRFDPADRNRIVGITLPDGRSSVTLDGIADHLEDYLEVSHPLRTSKWKTKRMNAFYNRYKVSRKAVVVPAPDDPDDPDRAVNKRLAQDVYGEEVRVDADGGRAGSDEETDAERQAREARNAENVNLAESDDAFDELRTKLLEEGTPIEELSAEEFDLLRASVGLDPDIDDIIRRLESNISLKSKIFGGISSFANSADLGDKICTVKNRLTAVVLAARSFRAISMLRYTSSFIKVADEARAGSATPGNIDPSMLNALLKRTTATDRNGNALGASPGFAYIIKNKFSKSSNEAFKGSYGVDGKLTGVPGAIHSGTNNIPGINATSCGIFQNPLAQGGLIVVELGLAVFSGGTSAAASAGARTAIKEGVERALKQIFSRRFIKSLAIGATIDISFEGIMLLTQLYAERATSLTFTGQEKGAELGDILAGGAGTLNKQRSLQAGMVPATSEEIETANKELNDIKQQELNNQSVYARYFDYDNMDSLAFTAASYASTLPLSADGMATYVSLRTGNFISSLFTKPFSFIASVFTQRAGAQSADEIEYETLEVKGDTLATDPAGNLIPIMREDIQRIDPEENISYLTSTEDIDPNSLEPKSDRFIKHIQNCVENADTISPLEFEDQSNPEYDCLAKQSITKRFKAHLAWLDMLDGIDAALFPEDIGSQTASSGGNRVAEGGLAWPLAQTKQQVENSLGGCLDSSRQKVCDAGHPYLAHDLFASVGTNVYAATGGEVIRARVGTCGHGFGSAFAVQIYNQETDTTYFYQHMDANSGQVSAGDTVSAGALLGRVGGSQASCNTEPHLHIDAVAGRGRPACSRKSCPPETKSRFVDISNALYLGYEAL